MLSSQSRSFILQNKNDFHKITRLLWFRFYSSSKNLPDTSESEGLVGFLKVFNIVKRPSMVNWHKYNPLSMSPQRYKEMKEKFARDAEIYQQKCIKERNELLGDDVAAAHFIIYGAGRVKFNNSDKWIKLNIEDETCEGLPNTYVNNLYLECLDCSNSIIRYEGLENLSNLRKLKWISFRNCTHFDDWFLDRITSEYADSLEYLDISDCFNVTENGLNCFYRFRKLKKLVIHNIVNSVSFKYSCLLLEDAIPGLTIEGVNYLDSE